MSHRLWGPRLTRRAFITGAFQLLAMGSLWGRLYSLQVRRRLHFHTLSEKNRIFITSTPAPRGTIYDCDGKILAGNKQVFRLILLAKTHAQFQESTYSLSQFTHPLCKDCLALLQLLEEEKPWKKGVCMLKDDLSWEEVAWLAIRADDLPGFFVEAGLQRYYPLHASGAHVVGYVARGSQEARVTPGLLVGKLGIEYQEDLLLQGKPSMQVLEVNAKRHVMRILESRSAVPGKACVTTLHAPLQEAIFQKLQAYPRAAVFVMDTTGAVRAVVSQPSFDPHLFSVGHQTGAWSALCKDAHYPLLNKATLGLYAPGSIIKMAVALAALEKGVITSHTRFHCPGYYKLQNHTYHCWKRNGHGSMNVVEAISESCDVFFYEIGRQTGIAQLEKTFRILGLGDKLGGILGVKTGLMPNPAWKEVKGKEAWTPGDTVLTSIGQGYITTTLCHLITLVARLATGRVITPFLIPSLQCQSEVLLPFNKTFLESVRQGMERAVNHPMGTVYGSRFIGALMPMAGKTGTSQVRRITSQERKAGHSSSIWQDKEHALFCGYAPFHEPKIVVGAIVEHGGSGSKVAAPLVADIFKMIDTLKLYT